MTRRSLVSASADIDYTAFVIKARQVVAVHSELAALFPRRLRRGDTFKLDAWVVVGLPLMEGV